MKLISDWRRVMRRAWSMRLMLLAGALTACEVVLPFFSDAFPRALFAILSGLSVAGAFVARVVAQKDIHEAD